MKTGIPQHHTRPWREVAFIAFLLLAALRPAGPLAADTILVVTEETVDGTACPPPLPLAEGLSAALFERGHIVFDAGQAAPVQETSSLLELARSGGAAWVLKAEAAFNEVPFGLDLRRIAATAGWTLLRAKDGSAAVDGTMRGSNEGAEQEADRAGLARKIAADIADEIAPQLDGGE
jgi:hypothetical protein